MKALEKDRTRRYETANGLAMDIQRHLASDPVVAGPRTYRYRLGKKPAKHWVALATTGAFAAVLVAATVTSASLAICAIRSEARANRVLRFLLDRVLTASRPEGEEGGLGHDVTMQAAFDWAEPKIASDFADEPIVAAAVRHTFGTTYLHHGDTAAAIRQYERAIAIRNNLSGPITPRLSVPGMTWAWPTGVQGGRTTRFACLKRS